MQKCISRQVQGRSNWTPLNDFFFISVVNILLNTKYLIFSYKTTTKFEIVIFFHSLEVRLLHLEQKSLFISLNWLEYFIYFLYKISDHGHDFGYGPINKQFIAPYLYRQQRSSAKLKINPLKLPDLEANTELWCPSDTMDNNQWITTLVLNLLDTFDSSCYLKGLIPLCKVKVVDTFSITIIISVNSFGFRLNFANTSFHV